MAANTFGQKSFKAKPPEKGSFPLDHEGECKEYMAIYMKCLRNNNMQNAVCRDESREYLECRMKRNLMTREDFNKLGYRDEPMTQPSST